MSLLLLLVLITQAADRAEMSTAGSELSSVPVPTNVTFEAYNFNTVLFWNYPVMPQTPVFTVQVKNYVEAVWIDACRTTQHHCNIFSLINDSSSPLWARVKARLGQEESAYAESKEFILCRQGKIGPPKLNVTHKENQIIIDIFHPLVIVNGKELGTIYDEDDACYSFIYNVYVRINGSMVPGRPYKQMEEDCTETQCQMSIPVSSLNSEYCVSAQGNSELWHVTTEKSKEICITILDHKSIENSVWIPIVAASVLFVILILLIIYCSTKKINPFERKSIMLPKSLMSVVKNASSEAKSESKYVSPVTYEPIVPENGTMVCEEQLSPATISSTQTKDSPGKAEHGEDLSHETASVTTEEKTSDMAPDSPLVAIRRGDSVLSSSNQSEPCSVVLNAYHSRNGSDSGLVESDSFLSDSEFPPNKTTEIKTKEPEPVTLRNTTTSFGYDKPHVLVDLLVDEGGKESLIGYRVTEGSSEFP